MLLTEMRTLTLPLSKTLPVILLEKGTLVLPPYILIAFPVEWKVILIWVIPILVLSQLTVYSI